MEDLDLYLMTAEGGAQYREDPAGQAWAGAGGIERQTGGTELITDAAYYSAVPSRAGWGAGAASGEWSGARAYGGDDSDDDPSGAAGSFTLALEEYITHALNARGGAEFLGAEFLRGLDEPPASAEGGAEVDLSDAALFVDVSAPEASGGTEHGAGWAGGGGGESEEEESIEGEESEEEEESEESEESEAGEEEESEESETGEEEEEDLYTDLASTTIWQEAYDVCVEAVPVSAVGVGAGADVGAGAAGAGAAGGAATSDRSDYANIIEALE